MDMGAGSRKRKSVELDSLEAGAGERTAGDQDQDQEPPLPAAGVDRISDLPDDVLGEIISLLPTQVLPSPWRRLWRSAPLNLHYSPFLSHEEALDVIISRILAAHPGPGRRFCAPVYHLHVDRANALLRSPALDNLHELELCSSESFFPSPPTTLEQPPAAAFRFSDTLRVATFGQCNLADATVQTLHFPKLQKLALKRVCISESSLHTLIAACPALECLLMQCISDCRCVRINSSCIRSIGVGGYNSRKEPKFEELVIENAPCLQSLLQLGTSDRLDISVISAPKLEALGYLSGSTTRLVFDSTVIQGFCVDDSSTTMVRSIKILAVHMSALSLDDVIKLMSCFPCLEKLYIQSNGPGENNVWRRKHGSLITSLDGASLDIRLKTIVWRIYRGIKSHVDFATFFLLNARVLELMTFEVNSGHYNDAFFEQQRKKLKVHSRASRGARLRFTSHWSYNYMMKSSVHDLDPIDLFERRQPPEEDTSVEICDQDSMAQGSAADRAAVNEDRTGDSVPVAVPAVSDGLQEKQRRKAEAAQAQVQPRRSKRGPVPSTQYAGRDWTR